MRPEHAVAAEARGGRLIPTSGTLPLTLAMLRRREVPSRSTAPVLRLQCGPASPDHVRDRLLEGSLRSAPQDDDGGGLRARAVRPRSGVGHHGAVQRAVPSSVRGAGCRFSGLLVERYVRLGAQVPPDIPRRSFRLLSGHPYGWADGSARSPGYRNRDRGTRPPLRQRCPVSTAVPPPETSGRVIGIKAGFVKAHRCATHPAPHPEVRSEAEPRRTQDGPAGSLRARACFEARLWLAPQHEERGLGWSGPIGPQVSPIS